MSAAAARIEGEWRELVKRAASRRPVKEVARNIGRSPRQVHNLRNGTCLPDGLTSVLLAQGCPELKSAFARWLGLAPGPEAAALRKEIEAVLARHPEEGDRQS